MSREPHFDQLADEFSHQLRGRHERQCGASDTARRQGARTLHRRHGDAHTVLLATQHTRCKQMVCQ